MTYTTNTSGGFRCLLDRGEGAWHCSSHDDDRHAIRLSDLASFPIKKKCWPCHAVTADDRWLNIFNLQMPLFRLIAMRPYFNLLSMHAGMRNIYLFIYFRGDVVKAGGRCCQGGRLNYKALRETLHSHYLQLTSPTETRYYRTGCLTHTHTSAITDYFRMDMFSSPSGGTASEQSCRLCLYNVIGLTVT